MAEKVPFWFYFYTLLILCFGFDFFDPLLKLLS